MSHAYAEAGMVYKLVIMQNKISVSDNLISRIHDQNFSLIGFNQLVIKDILDSYSYMCVLDQCRILWPYIVHFYKSLFICKYYASSTL